MINVLLTEDDISTYLSFGRKSCAPTGFAFNLLMSSQRCLKIQICSNVVFVGQNEDVVITNTYKRKLFMTLIDGIFLTILNAAICLVLPKLLSLTLSTKN